MSPAARRALVAALALAVVFVAGHALRPRPGLSPPASAPLCALPVEVAGRGLRCDAPIPARAGDVIGDGRVVGRMAGARLDLLGVAVDVNRGTVDELESLPGIGPQLARRIVAGRPYASVEDLRRVAGIGQRRLSQMRARLSVTPPPR